MTAASGVRRLRLGGRAALFCERSQRLFELNDAADRVWQALARGLTPAEAVQASQAPGADVVQTSVVAWFDAGHLLPAEVVAAARSRPAAELHLRIDGLAWAVGLHGEGLERLRGEIEAAFGQFLAGPRPPISRISIVSHDGACFILADGASLGRFTPERVVPELKAALTDRLACSVGDGAFLLHAALLDRTGRGLLISGAPGAGKTTLTLALAASGWGYGSDDIVRVDPDGGLTGVPFSPAVKTGAWPLLAPIAPGLAQVPIHLRNDGQYVRYAPVADFAPAEVDTLGWVLALDRREDRHVPVLEPVEPLAMLAHLLGGAFSADHRLQGEALDAFAAQLAQAQCRRLVYADLAGAMAAIEALAVG